MSAQRAASHHTAPGPFTRLHWLRSRAALWGLTLLALLCLAGGAGWLSRIPPPTPPTPRHPPQTGLAALESGSVAAMDSPAITYSEGWRVTTQGADPGEPAAPWAEPAGVLAFDYTGRELALNLAAGDYWGYLYVTVNGQPANQLPVIANNPNSRGQAAGYRTLYAPERQRDNRPTAGWHVVHRTPAAVDSTVPQIARIEVWRSWGQTPLRGIAVDGLTPAPRPRWPGVLLLLAGGWLLLFAAQLAASRPWARLQSLRRLGAAAVTALTRPMAHERIAFYTAGLAIMLVALAVRQQIWWLSLMGLAALAYASVRRPSLWAGAFLLGLPFYFSQDIPLLPGRATNLVDLGLLGGVLVALSHWPVSDMPPSPSQQSRRAHWVLIGAGLLASWAAVAAAAAAHADVAWREWRTVFLAALLWSVLLWACRSEARSAPQAVRRRLLGGWLLGAVAMAGIGLAQFAGQSNLIAAEGVQRVAALYGSPNNLALYLERILFLPLSFLLFLPNSARRGLALLLTAILGSALLLTFSKGALLLGLPAGLLVLWVGGLWLLRRQGRSRRPLWWVGAAAALFAAGLFPYLGTERFRSLLDFSSGTVMIRLHLWRSSWQMALDHPWLGIGPDNFLYTYRTYYLLPAAWQEPDLNHPHNFALDWWTRLGLPGLLLGVGLFAAVAGLLLWRVRQSGRAALPGTSAPTPANSMLANSTPTHEAALWLGLLAGAAAALAHGLIDLSYAVPDLMMVWILWLALPLAFTRRPPSEQHGSNTQQSS